MGKGQKEKHVAMEKPKYPMVLIEWEDSNSTHSGWQSIESYPVEPCTCISMGFLTRETDCAVVLFAHIDGTGQSGTGEMVIPISAIRKRSILTSS